MKLTVTGSPVSFVCALLRTGPGIRLVLAGMLLLVAVLNPYGKVQAQGAAVSPVFPSDRHQELMDEFDFTPPPEEEPEPVDSGEKWNWDWGDWDINFSPSVTYTILAILLGLLGLLIYRMLGDVSTRKRTLTGENADRIDVEDIQEEELVAAGVSLSLLERAERARQFDLAIRLHYIQLLKELQDAGLIKYRKDFTNRDYQNQLVGKDFLADFRAVSREYERYWFGKYPIDRLSYRNTQKQFSALTERIHSSSTKAVGNV